jgi:hypothetical protein
MPSNPRFRTFVADNTSDNIIEQFLLAEMGSAPAISLELMQHLASVTNVATGATNAALRSYVPAFKKDMSTSILSGNLWIHEALNHANPRYMSELFGIDAECFRRLVHDLGLEDGRSVSKELQLAMFFQVVRGVDHLRQIGDRDQRAKDTISNYFKLTMSKLYDREGFYSRNVYMPSARSATPSFLLENPRFSRISTIASELLMVPTCRYFTFQIRGHFLH